MYSISSIIVGHVFYSIVVDVILIIFHQTSADNLAISKRVNILLFVKYAKL